MDIIPLSKWIPNLKHPLVIAGPCSAESEKQILKIAQGLSQCNQVQVFRAGIWKPRTRPGSFEGVGEAGLPWLKKVKELYGLKTTTEVATAAHVEMALKHDIDILWIGARTSANPFSVQEIADALKGVDIPVLVKNPVNADIALWIGALERINRAGLKKIAAIHRGFSTFEKNKYRNPPMWHLPIELMRRLPTLPMICDPSHISGKRNLISYVCQKAMDTDMNGIMVETHNDPDKALSDAGQQITPKALIDIIQNLNYRSEYSSDYHFSQELERLRDQIDRVDHEMLEIMKLRMKIVEKIGQLKLENNVTALQVNRMDELIKDRQTRALDLGLREEYVDEIYKVIHAESVKKQTDMMSTQIPIKTLSKDSKNQVIDEEEESENVPQ